MASREHKILKTAGVFLITCGATAAVLYLLFRNINFQTLFKHLQNVDQAFLIIACGVSVFWNIGLYALIRKQIWRYMGFPVTFRECLFIRAGSLPFQAIPSFKDTGLAMALYLKKIFKMPLSEGILSNIVVNFFSLMGLLFLALMGYLFYGPESAGLLIKQHHLAVKLIPVFLIVVCIAYIFYFNQALGKRILFYAFFKKRNRLYSMFEKNIDLWKKLPGEHIIFLFLLSTFFKLTEILIFCLLAQAYQLKIPLASILLYVPLAMIISESPANISGIGVREGALVFFFFNFAPKETLLAIAVLIFILNRIFPILIGLFFLYPFLSRIQLSFIKIREGVRSGTADLL